ncbi:MAG: hypothetical protein CMF24_05590, partial [Ilumatobacter sp.]|nr:hypothetical protein [Ilumatobacter sp.]
MGGPLRLSAIAPDRIAGAASRYVAPVKPLETAASTGNTDVGRGLLGAGVAVCAWSVGTILAKGIEMGGLALGAYRFWIFGIGLVIWMQVRGMPFSAQVMRKSMWGGLALGADIALFFTAVKETSIVNATIIGSLQPILVGI